MTDAQFGVLVTVLGAGLAGIGAAIRFSMSRIVVALDASSKALIDNTASNAVLATKIDSIAEFVHRERDKQPTPVEGVPVKGLAGGRYEIAARKKSEPGER